MFVKRELTEDVYVKGERENRSQGEVEQVMR